MATTTLLHSSLLLRNSRLEKSWLHINLKILYLVNLPPGETIIQALAYYQSFMNSRNYNKLFFYLVLMYVLPLTVKSQQLTDKIITIDVFYAAFACPCAQWTVETKQPGNEPGLHIYLEPSSSNLINADSLWDGEHLPLKLKLTGQYYVKDGFPKNYKPIKGDPEPAKVFRYTKIRIISK